MEWLKASLPFLYPILIVMAAKIGETILSGGKVSKEKVKKIMLEFCGECDYKSRALKANIVEQGIILAARILQELHGEMKSDFMSYCSKIMPKEKILESNVFTLFENTFNSAEEKIIDELRIQLVQNNFSKMNSKESLNRAHTLWKILNNIFDQYYRTQEKPGRIELYDFFNKKKGEYVSILERIFLEIKEIYFNE